MAPWLFIALGTGRASIGVVVDVQRTEGDNESILRDADLAMFETATGVTPPGCGRDESDPDPCTPFSGEPENCTRVQF